MEELELDYNTLNSLEGNSILDKVKTIRETYSLSNSNLRALGGLASLRILKLRVKKKIYKKKKKITKKKNSGE